MKGLLGRLTKGGLKSRLEEVEQAKREQAEQKVAIEERLSTLSRELNELKTLLESQQKGDVSLESEARRIKEHVLLISNELSKTKAGLAALQREMQSTAEHYESQLSELTSTVELLFRDVQGWKDVLKAEIEHSLSPTTGVLIDITQLLERALEMISENREHIQALREQGSPTKKDVQQELEEEPTPEEEPATPEAREKEAEPISLDEVLRELEPKILKRGKTESSADVVSPSLDDEVKSLIRELCGREERREEPVVDVEPERAAEPPETPIHSYAPVSTPILSHIEKDLITQRLCLEWLEFLMEMVGRNNIPDLLEYYVELGWISEEVQYELLSYVRGIDYFVEKDSWKLSADDHIKSYWFVRKIAKKPIKRSELKMLKRQVEIAMEKVEQRL